MSDNKTKPTGASVDTFIAGLDNQTRRTDSATLLKIFADVTGMPPRMWGDSIIGYGEYQYKYASGRAGTFFLTGFSPRKTAMTIYVMPGFSSFGDQLARLGPHKHSSSCLYVTRLARVDLTVLAEIIADSVSQMKQKYSWKE